ncbi:MAG: Rrf2 family transcriptional regulator, partial [Firmicutes bacterium]|nr:Rrf2 family transcriptional regulator [Bacillota bacterium]
LRAMVDLALHAEGGPVPLKEIAERQGLSESYLEQVFAVLRRAGLVMAIRGPMGGYTLGRPAEEISAGEILRVLEGDTAPVYCVERMAPRARCEREPECPTREFWRKLRDHIDAFLDRTTLRDLVERARRKDEAPPMYYI